MHSFLFNRLRPCPYHTGIPAKGQKPNFSEKGELNPILTRFPNLLFQTKPVVPPRILANAGCFRDGNRAASSRSGAADCLEALGVNINASKETMERALREENICFMFAQKYHSAMKYVAPVRRELGIRTIFNVLGPLTNPAHATRMVLGVFNADYVDKIAAALNQLGVTDALVVFGEDGLDEISACGETEVAELRHGKVERYTVKPEDFGLTRCTKADLVGGTALENAEITKNILLGKSTPAQRTAAVLNAGAAIYVAIDGLSLKDAMQKAQDVIDDGSAYKKLQAFIRITNEEDDQ